VFLGYPIDTPMKNHTLPVLALLAATAAVILIPVSASAACAALTVTGLASLLCLDYEPRGYFEPRAKVLAFEAAPARPEALGRAA
jgi:hypothetical protein